MLGVIMETYEDLKESISVFKINMMIFLSLLFLVIVMKGKTFKCVYLNFPILKQCRK